MHTCIEDEGGDSDSVPAVIRIFSACSSYEATNFQGFNDEVGPLYARLYSKGALCRAVGASGLVHSVSGGFQGRPQQANSPTADADSDKAGKRHYPLRNPVLASYVGVPPAREPAGFLLRFVVFLGLVFAIMPAAGRFSARDGGRNGWRFYGGLAGGFGLWLLCGTLLFALT